ncbi:MAG: SDR family NAD(P)-dependent oxidoreductase [Clostridia bacterium]|nr:SDR family NAD(P)-dependent oxidoreductase [Clostridia bacterium]
MNIAVVTGASSGLGEEFVKQINNTYKNLDEIWLIARRKERLEEIAKSITVPCRILALDITKDADIALLNQTLNDIKPNVKILVNNAGYGKLGNFENLDIADNAGMITLNCQALTVITQTILPFMPKNSEIINISSIASFVPNARMAVYCSTKAYVTSFSRALRHELKPKKINVLAVCPGPMATEFLKIADITPGASRTFDTLPYVKAENVAKKSIIASKKGRAVYTNRVFYKFYRFLSRIVPHKILMLFSAT